MVMALVMMMGNTVDKIREHVKVKVTQVNLAAHIIGKSSTQLTRAD